MNQIWDISRIPLPFSDLVSTDTHDNPYTEWTQDTLAPIDLSDPDAVPFHEGADTNTIDDTVLGERVGNHSQINVKVVPVSQRAQRTENIGRSNELAYQVMRRQQDLRRLVDATAVYPQASQKSKAGAADTDKGMSAGLPSWLTTNTEHGIDGSAGGFGATTGDIVDAPTTGDARALSEATVRSISQSVYEEGGEASVIMMVPGVCAAFSAWLFDSAARVATLQSDQGKSEEKATALGAVNVFVSDFSTLRFVPNRLQQTYLSSDVSPIPVTDVFILDPMYLRLSYLQGYRTEPLAKTGLSDKRQMCVDWTLKVLTEKGCGVIRDINPALTIAVA